MECWSQYWNQWNVCGLPGPCQGVAWCFRNPESVGMGFEPETGEHRRDTERIGEAWGLGPSETPRDVF